MSRRFQFSLIVVGILVITALVFCIFFAGVLFSRIETDGILKRQAENFQKEREHFNESLRKAVSEISELEQQLELEKRKRNTVRKE